MTRGEAGIPSKSAPAAAAIRTAECQRADAILRARPIFAVQVDGHTEGSPSRYADFAKVLEAEHPDIVFTYWPIDTHRDHRAVSLLVYDAWVGGDRNFALTTSKSIKARRHRSFIPLIM